MSRTVTIPGGTAELFDRAELTPRRTIPYQILLNRADELMSKLAAARKVTAPDGQVEENPNLDGPEHRLTYHESEMLEYLQLASNWGWLKSWTIDLPLPATWEGLLDVPKPITDALHVAILMHASNRTPEVASDFEMSKETLEDKESFTGASEEPKTQSGAAAKRRKSTPKTSTS
jgi:hypothetical protein